MQGKIKIGPVGNRDPKTATMVAWDEGSHNGLLSQIFISHGGAKGIFSIQFQFMLDDDKFVLSDQHGSNFGDKFDVITLNCPHEYITGISGEYSTYIHGGKSPHICSLKVATNTSEYGPFGSLTDYHQKFEFKLGKYSQFGGFHGTYDVWGLHHIGVYLQPTNVRPKSKPKTGTNNAKETESTIVLG